MQILIAGCGPSALLLAAACRQEGLTVAVVGPGLGDEMLWPNRYGAWEDELQPLGLASALERTWSQALVWLDHEAPLRIPRRYGRVDNQALLHLLLERCRSGAQPALLLDDHVEAVTHGEDHSDVLLGSGQRLRARVFVDATGANSAMTRRAPGAASAFQLAYGILASVEGLDADPDSFTMMDWRPAHPGIEQEEGYTPSFLYAMPMGEKLAFLEETILISQKETCAKPLQARLMARLQHRGIRVTQIHEVELCRIPMDAPLPCVPQRGLAFGAAASLVHPATGYMLARAAALAPRVARALADGLGRSLRAPEVVEQAWAVIWPAQALRAWELYSFGAQVLCQMEARSLRQFYQAFFSQPEEAWGAYLSWGLTPWQIGQMMWGVYQRCPPAIRKRLRGAALHNPAPVARGWLGWGAASIAPRPQSNLERGRPGG